jgi:UDP-GlcNAc:undecaprenyl-phosphate GlcNAc-1-phosphate transferase
VLKRLAVGAGLFFLLGLIDDRHPIPGWRKLAFQTVIAILVVSGFGVTATAWIPVPHVAEVLSILWIVAVVNAYNLFDHADGLAAGAGATALAALALGQMAVGEQFVPALALVTAGALAGFLVHNLPPARLFMGDAGSMPVGFLLASLAIVARYYFPEEGTSRYVVLVPLAVLAVPLFDAACVTVGRIARGRSPLVGDATSHLGHRLLARGWSPRAAAALATGAAAATGAASILLYRLSGWALLVPAGIVTAVLAILLYVRRTPAEARP